MIRLLRCYWLNITISSKYFSNKVQLSFSIYFFEQTETFPFRSILFDKNWIFHFRSILFEQIKNFLFDLFCRTNFNFPLSNTFFRKAFSEPVHIISPLHENAISKNPKENMKFSSKWIVKAEEKKSNLYRKSIDK